MKERPILFSAPMVKALLAGTKTQTRRLVKPPEPGLAPVTTKGGRFWIPEGQIGDGEPNCKPLPVKPYAGKGDHLWVRESLVENDDGWSYAADGAPVQLERENPRYMQMVSWAHHKEGERCNSIHMPRFASRITLEVTEVRVERLQSISEEDAKAEGLEENRDDGVSYYGPLNAGHVDPRQAFAQLWDSINGERASWASSPWVWVVSFRRLP